VQFFPEWTVTPPGPLVVALTCPFPAETDADMPPAPLPDRVTVQARCPFDELPVTTVLLPLEPPTLTELLTCACAIDPPMQINTSAIAGMFKVPSCRRMRARVRIVN